MAMNVATRLFNADEYYKMAEAGILKSGERLELIGGKITLQRAEGATQRKFTVDEYYKMAEVGLLNEDDRVELIDGEIIQMSPIGTRHFKCVNRLNKLLSKLIPDNLVVSVQNPVRIDEGNEPQPDVAIVPDDSDAKHIFPKDVLLLIEVADSTYYEDRNIKIPMYARAGIPEVWLANLPKNTIEAFSNPVNGSYTEIRLVNVSDKLQSRRLPSIVIEVGKVLNI